MTRPRCSVAFLNTFLRSECPPCTRMGGNRCHYTGGQQLALNARGVITTIRRPFPGGGPSIRPKTVRS